MAKKKEQIDVKNIKIKIQSGSKRDVFAEWSYSKKMKDSKGDLVNRVATFEWEWQYKTGASSKWFEGGTGSAKRSINTATYSTPSNAIKVRFKLRPVSDTYTSNKKEHNYFESEYSKWVEFENFLVQATPPTNQVKSKQLLLRPCLEGDDHDPRPYAEAYWFWDTDENLKGYEYTWEYYDSLYHIYVESGEHSSGTTEQPITVTENYVKTVKDKNGKKDKVKFKNKQCGYSRFVLQPSDSTQDDKNDYNSVRFSVTPVLKDDAEGAFKPVVQRESCDIYFETLKPKKAWLSASTITTEYTAFWWYDTKKDEHITSFEVQWQYKKEEKTYFENVSRDYDEFWATGGSGSVNVNDSYSNLSEDVRWSYSFSPQITTINKPDGSQVKIFPEVRFRVKPICDETKSFIQEWSDWYTYVPTVDSASVTNVSVVAPNPVKPRSLRASWSLDSFYHDRTASFAYEWYYRIDASDTYHRGNNGTIDFSAGVTTGNQSTWEATYDAPTDAKLVIFRVRPVPNVDTAFVGAWCEDQTHSFSVPVLSVKNVNISIYNAANRTVYASWQDGDYDQRISWLITQIRSGKISLSSLGIPGDPAQYSNAQLEEAIRAVIITNFDVRWKYYYLDRWFDGSGSSSVTGYTTQYTVPEEASKISVSVKPNPVSTDIFVGVFSEPKEQSMKPSSLEVDAEKYLTVGWYQNSDTEVAARLKNIAKFVPKSPDQFNPYNIIFEWYSKRYGEWESSETQSIPANTELSSILSTWQVPEYSEEVRVRVRIDINDLKYTGQWSKYANFPIKISPGYVANVEIFVQSGSRRTCVATWDDGTLLSTNVDSYEYKWQYQIDNIWYDGSSGSASTDAPNSTYDAPENATSVRVAVKPVPVLSQYFEGMFTEWQEFQVPVDTTPDVPDVPSLELVDGYHFTATVESYDTKTKSIEFEIVNENAVWKTQIIDLTLNRAIFQFDVAAGFKYRARARGVNAQKDVGDWSNYSGEQSSYPAPLPAKPTVKATSSTSVELDWKAPSTGTVTGYVIEYAKKKRYFDAAPEQVTSADRDTNVTHAELINMDASEWWFRIASKNSVGNSTWTEPVNAFLGKIPTAPTTWSSRTTAQLGDSIYLYWTHNCEDNSAETYAQIEITINGVTNTYTQQKDEEDTSTSSYLINGSSLRQESVIEWRVRTKGVMPDYGDWSTQRIINVYAPPTLQVSLGVQNGWIWDTFQFSSENIYNASGTRIPLPGNIVTQFPVPVYLNAYPVTQTPVSYIVTVMSNNAYDEFDETGTLRKIIVGSEIYKKYYNTSKASFMTMLLPDNINLQSGMSYTLHATVAMSSGLTAEASIIFSVNWKELDYDLNAEIGYNDDDLTCTIRPYANAEEEGQPDPTDVLLYVYRRDFDGGLTEIGSKLSNVTRPTVVDPHPALDYARYRIVAQSTTTGAISFIDLIGYPIGETSIVIQWDEAWESYDVINEDAFADQPWTGSLLKLPYNINISDSNNVDVEMIEYIGRKHPVSYYGTQVGQTANWSAEVPKDDKETLYALRRLAVYMGNAYVREPNGSGYWAQVAVSFSISYDSLVIPVTINVTRVEGGK